MLRTNIALWTLCICALAASSYAAEDFKAEPTAYDRLHDAIKRGDLTETEWLAQRFPDVVNESQAVHDMQGFNYYPAALERAVRNDDQTMAQLLLKFGADVNPKGETVPLHLVKSAGVAQVLIDAGARVERRDRSYNTPSTGNSPLHGALDVAIAKALVAAGAELNCPNVHGRTPVSTAIHGERIAVAVFLLERGAKVESSDVEALTSACRQGELEIVRQILAQGVKIGDCQDFGTDTMQAACESGNKQLVKFLLERGGNPTAQGKHDPPPAVQTARMPLRLEMEHHDHAAILKLLRDAGAKLDVRDDEGNTLLHLAAKAGNPETARFLISCGLDVKVRNKDDQTPLHLAAMVAGEFRGLSGDPKHHAAVAELLLLHGADPRSEAKITKELRVLANDGQSFEITKITETFTPSRYAARRSKWSAYDGEIDISQCENPESGLGLYLIQGATQETNAQIAKDVENGNRAREAVGEVLKRFGAE
ncbi:MAG: ankyrin repeat domain-containing protein [Pirellulaceae bacterium]